MTDQKISYVLLTTMGKVPIDADELEKAVRCMQTGQVGLFRRGVVKGAFIGQIVEDVWRKKGVYYGHDVEREIGSPRVETLLSDKFEQVRSKLQDEKGDIKQIG